MKFIQQFTTGDWDKPLHRLIVIDEAGTRLTGAWTGYEHAATVEDPRMPFNGWVSYTDYYEGVMPRVSRYESVDGLASDGSDMVTKDEVPQSEWLNDTAAVPDSDKCEVAQEVSDIADPDWDDMPADPNERAAHFANYRAAKTAATGVDVDAAIAASRVDSYPQRLLHESDESLAERRNSWHVRNPLKSMMDQVVEDCAKDEEFCFRENSDNRPCSTE